MHESDGQSDTHCNSSYNIYGPTLRCGIDTTYPLHIRSCRSMGGIHAAR